MKKIFWTKEERAQVDAWLTEYLIENFGAIPPVQPAFYLRMYKDLNFPADRQRVLSAGLASELRSKAREIMGNNPDLLDDHPVVQDVVVNETPMPVPAQPTQKTSTELTLELHDALRREMHDDWIERLDEVIEQRVHTQLKAALTIMFGEADANAAMAKLPEPVLVAKEAIPELTKKEESNVLPIIRSSVPDPVTLEQNKFKVVLVGFDGSSSHQLRMLAPNWMRVYVEETYRPNTLDLISHCHAVIQSSKITSNGAINIASFCKKHNVEFFHITGGRTASEKCFNALIDNHTPKKQHKTA